MEIKIDINEAVTIIGRYIKDKYSLEGDLKITFVCNGSAYSSYFTIKEI